MGSKDADPATESGVERLIRTVGPDMERVNALIYAMAGSNVDLIPEIANHLVSSGGKRLRPMLTLASAHLFDATGDAHVKLAAAVEFMHTATLLHDDVVDDSAVRRGKPAARVIWGNQASVLVGDFLLGQAFKTMVEAGSLECLRILSTASAVIAEGEVLQLSGAKSLAKGEDHYMAVIEAKTAALFSAATEVGPVITGNSGAAQDAMRRYGLYLGLAFQLIDDVLDYGGNRDLLGKETGDDFREGKATLPVIYAYQRSDDADKAFWKRCIEDGEIRDEDLDAAIEKVRTTGAIDDTIAVARGFGKKATDALSDVPPSPLRDTLGDVVEFAIARAF
ncbi:polyprenyl synthetase family protein [Amorphus orientalis]|uniref:polyprenyl synthetase family protein n=1 Tax=Amorphus orientalis TaxID=649198 RepID=UPI00351F9C3E